MLADDRIVLVYVLFLLAEILVLFEMDVVAYAGVDVDAVVVAAVAATAVIGLAVFDFAVVVVVAVLSVLAKLVSVIVVVCVVVDMIVVVVQCQMMVVFTWINCFGSSSVGVWRSLSAAPYIGLTLYEPD